MQRLVHSLNIWWCNHVCTFHSYALPKPIIFTSLPVFKSSSSEPPPQPPVVFKESDHSYYRTIEFYIFQYPNALLFEFLLFLFPSHGAEESSIEQSSTASWSAGLIILVDADLAVKSSLKEGTCACITRIRLCLCLCAPRQITWLGEYFQMAEFRTFALSAQESRD